MSVSVRGNPVFISLDSKSSSYILEPGAYFFSVVAGLMAVMTCNNLCFTSALNNSITAPYSFHKNPGVNCELSFHHQKTSA